MALTTTKRWIWPPNWDGNPPENGGWKKVTIHLTGRCVTSGAEEVDVVKLDISELRKLDGTVPTRTVVEKLQWDITGISNVLLEWDRNPHSVIAVLSGRGNTERAIVDDSDGIGDGTGDILLTTLMDANSSYDITMTVRLK